MQSRSEWQCRVNRIVTSLLLGLVSSHTSSIRWRFPIDIAQRAKPSARQPYQVRPEPTLNSVTTQRAWMTLPLQPPHNPVECSLAPNGFICRSLIDSDELELAALMYESYRGTVDDGGESIEDARREIAKLLSGDYGPIDQEAVTVIIHEDTIVSATIVTRDQVAPPPLQRGEPFLVFSMTAPNWKRRGLARIGLTRSITLLQRRGEPRLHLVVTRANIPALSLYKSLGFLEGPIGGPPFVA